MVITQKQMVFDVVQDRIIAGEIRPGDQVSEKALARELHCSIIPVREALGQLISLGVFQKLPHHGTFARRLTPEEMLAEADWRLVNYTFAVGRAAACPDPEGLAALRAAFCALEDQVRGVVDPGLVEGPEERWLDFLTGTVRELMRVFRGIVLCAGLRNQAEVYWRSDMVYILSSRNIWSALSRAAMIGFVREMFWDDPMSCFLPAVEAQDPVAAQRLHRGQHQRMTENVVRRLIDAGVPFPAPASTFAALTNATFEFEPRGRVRESTGAATTNGEERRG